VAAQLDELDLRILDELSKNGWIPPTKLARKLRVPRTTLNSRMNRLADLGLVRGYRANLYPRELKLTQGPTSVSNPER